MTERVIELLGRFIKNNGDDCYLMEFSYLPQGDFDEFSELVRKLVDEVDRKKKYLQGIQAILEIDREESDLD